MYALVNTGDLLVHLYSFLILVRILLSWVTPSLSNPVIRAVAQLTDPFLGVFRNLLPPIGMIDLSPMIALFVLEAGWALLRQLLLGF